MAEFNRITHVQPSIFRRHNFAVMESGLYWMWRLVESNWKHSSHMWLSWNYNETTEKQKSNLGRRCERHILISACVANPPCCCKSWMFPMLPCHRQTRLSVGLKTFQLERLQNRRPICLGCRERPTNRFKCLLNIAKILDSYFVTSVPLILCVRYYILISDIKNHPIFTCP